MENNEYGNGEYGIPLAERKILTQVLDPPISSLCDKIDKGKIEVRAEFQRQYVWESKPIIKSRLIESAILNIPIPAIYTAEDEKTGKELVIDGQQRLLTFHGFINNKFPLKGLSVLSELNGYFYKDLSNVNDDNIKKLVDKIGDLQEIISSRPIRVIKILKESHPDIKFEIFERLNRGSVQLNDQELRNCIYRGSFNDLIKELTINKDFQRLQGLKTPHSRMMDAERILRFFAFCDKGEKNYAPPLKKFLNDYIKSKQNISESEIEKKKQLFKKSVELCQTVFGELAFRRVYLGNEENPNGKIDKSLNQGIIDIQMYGFMEYGKKDIIPKAELIKDAFIKLVTTDKEFIDTIEIGTYSTNQVKKRTELWIKELRKIANLPSNDKRLFSYEDKKRFFDANNTCEICKNKIAYIEDAHMDHIERFSEGGETKIKNARLTHRYCNLERG